MLLVIGLCVCVGFGCWMGYVITVLDEIRGRVMGLDYEFEVLRKNLRDGGIIE